MRREIVEAYRRGILEVEARQRQLEFDRVLGTAALAADHRLRALDPVVVARLILKAQRRARRGFGWLGERDRRRVVGNDRDRPAAEHRPALAQGEQLAAAQGGFETEILLVERGEIADLAIDRQARHGAAAMHLGK